MSKFSMPPVEFSNAMNIIYVGWDFRNWEMSKEWKLFNAGRAAVAREAQRDLKQLAELCEKVVRQ